jgi:UDP-glucose 4-epimerase
MRVLVTGMGGEIGTRVAQLLEEHDEITEIAGCDYAPPRRRLRRSEFKRIDARDRDRLVAFVEDFAPHAVAHFGIYEPDSRLSPREAVRSTEACTVSALGAAARAGSLQRIVVRSGLSVYGRGRGRALMPDEDAPLAPGTDWGRLLLEVESLAVGIARRKDVPVAARRYSTIAGSHVPSPLGRVLRLPTVPVPALADPPFSLLDRDDAARAMVEALLREHDGPLNVVGPGATSPWQAVRFGNRLPLPVEGFGWRWARRMTEFLGAPMPDHVMDVLRRGLTGDGSRAYEALGLGFVRPTQEVLADLYAWATVTPITEATRRVA